MKKIFTLLFVVAALASSAQSLRLIYNGQTINNSDTIDINAAIGSSVSTFIGFSNIINDDIYFKVKMDTTQKLHASSFSFCIDGTCYSGILSSTIFLSEGSSVSADDPNALHLTYSTPVNGISLIPITFYNTDNQDDQVCVIIRYSTGVGVKDNQTSDIALRAYPNPATTSVTLSYSVNNMRNAYMVIKNLAGMEMYRAPLSSSGKMNVNTSDFRSGVYLYGIEENGKMQYTKKLLIK